MASRADVSTQITRGNTPLDLGADPKVHMAATRNAVRLFDSQPDVSHNSTEWYSEANDLAHRDRAASGAPTPRHAAGILAAVSPGSTWDGNNDSSLRHIGRINRRDTDAILQGDHGPLSGTSMSQLTAKNVGKALRIRAGEDPDDVLGGVKTNNFFHNINGENVDPAHPRGRVTVDFHTFDSLVNRKQNVKAARDISGNVNEPLKSGAPNAGVRRYEAAADVVRDATSFVNTRDGSEYEPHQFQSGLWVVSKTHSSPGHPRLGQPYL